MRLFVVVLVLASAAVLGDSVAGARKVQSSTPEIEVLDAGSEPREALRLAPAVGSSERSAMTVRFTIEQSGASDATLKAPPIRVRMEATLQDINANGDLHATFSYPSFDVLKGNGASAKQRRSLQQSLAGLTGVTGELTLTTRGALVDSNLDIPPGLDPNTEQLLGQLRDQFRDVTVPLPEPEVGVGARWRATTQLTLNGIEARQVYEYRLKKRTGTTLELDVRGTQTAKRQTVDTPGGATLRVKSYKTTYRGTTVADLTGLLPVSSRIRGSGDQTFDLRAGDERGELRQHVDVRVDLEQG
jgi:Family of unknown function (DUF6263)